MSEKSGYFFKMPGISGISTIVNGNTISLNHKRAPQALSSIAHTTLAPVLGRQKGQAEITVDILFIPCGFYHLQVGEPAFYQSPRIQATKEFKLRIIYDQTCHTRLVQMVKMIVTNKQIVYLTKIDGSAGN